MPRVKCTVFPPLVKEEKHLNQQIDSITIQNNKVSCLTKMGISHILEDIKSVDDLVNKIRSVIV